MIIYGTGNFNRRNQSLVRCGCPACGRRDYQRSYTSTRFFTLYFIPVIPLGSQKVLQECQHCKNAYGLSLGDFKRLVNKELPKAIEEFTSEPTNEPKAKTLISLLIRSQKVDTLRELAPQIANNFSNNGEMLCLLAEACSYLCLDQLADDYFLMSVNATEDPEIAASAEHHMKDKGSTKPAPPNRILQSLPVFIVPAIILFFVGSFLSKTLSNRPEQIYLVNGLDQAYEVFVNDERVRLQPHSRIEGDMLHYETNTIRPVEGSLPIEKQTFTIAKGDVSQRAFDDTVFVINPDRAALLSWERTSYTTSPNPVDDFKFKIHTGKVLYSFSNVDFAFREFPEEISMPASSTKVYRTRISQIEDASPTELVSWLARNDMEEELKSYLASALRFEPDDNILIRTALQTLTPKQFDELAQPHLEARPVEVAWHRAHQDSRDVSLESETETYYRGLYENAPQDNQLAYLYGRACTDPQVAEKVFKAAADSSQPSGYASYGLSYHYMVEGDFPSTLKYCDQALKWLPADQGFSHPKRVAQFGLGDFRSIAREAEQKLDQGLDFAALYDFAYATTKLGDRSAALEKVDSEIKKWADRNQVSAEDARLTHHYFDCAIALSSGDASEYLSVAKANEKPAYKFQSYVLEGKLAAASRLIQDDPDAFSPSDHLLLAVLAKQSGDPALDQKHMQLAISGLSSMQQREQKWARWLAGQAPQSRSEVLHNCSNIDQQVLLLAALGKSSGSKGSDYLAHAQKLVYQETFYSLALKDAQVF